MMEPEDPINESVQKLKSRRLRKSASVPVVKNLNQTPPTEEWSDEYVEEKGLEKKSKSRREQWNDEYIKPKKSKSLRSKRPKQLRSKSTKSNTTRSTTATQKRSNSVKTPKDSETVQKTTIAQPDSLSANSAEEEETPIKSATESKNLETIHVPVPDGAVSTKQKKAIKAKTKKKAKAKAKGSLSLVAQDQDEVGQHIVGSTDRTESQSNEGSRKDRSQRILDIINQIEADDRGTDCASDDPNPPSQGSISRIQSEKSRDDQTGQVLKMIEETTPAPQSNNKKTLAEKNDTMATSRRVLEEQKSKSRRQSTTCIQSQTRKSSSKLETLSLVTDNKFISGSDSKRSGSIVIQHGNEPSPWNWTASERKIDIPAAIQVTKNDDEENDRLSTEVSDTNESKRSRSNLTSSKSKRNSNKMNGERGKSRRTSKTTLLDPEQPPDDPLQNKSSYNTDPLHAAGDIVRSPGYGIPFGSVEEYEKSVAKETEASKKRRKMICMFMTAANLGIILFVIAPFLIFSKPDDK